MRVAIDTACGARHSPRVLGTEVTTTMKMTTSLSKGLAAGTSARVAAGAAKSALMLAAGLAAAAALGGGALPGGPAVNQLDLHPPVTRIASDVYVLHYWILIVCVVIFVAVFGVMFWSILRHRKSI